MKLPDPNTVRRRLLHAGSSLALLGLLPPAARAATASATSISMLEAINQAGRQRMLSQRMAKLYAQAIREVRQAEALKLIGESVVVFEKQLGNLRSFVQHKNATEVMATYEQLDARWSAYKKVIGASPTSEGLRQVAALNEQVLTAANAGATQLEKLHGGSLGKLVNLSGRQRMLSQRISKFYFFQRDGIASPDSVKNQDAARAEFLTAMNTLKQTPENTHDINSWLALAESQWMFFDQAVRADPSAKQELAYHDNNVAVTSENILQAMDKLTNLYAQLS